MRVVTTCHKAGFEQYGQGFLDGMHNWPKGTEFRWYQEGFDYSDGIPITTIDRLNEFKKKHQFYVAPDWRFDVVRFANKVYAAWDAFKDYEGIGVWLDCDTVTYNEIPEGYVEKLLNGKFLAILNRTGMWTETGFWVMDCSNPIKKQFFDTWLWWYESGGFKTLPHWHDCMTLDATIRRLEIDYEGLSGKHHKDSHPLSKIDLGKYIDHTKGDRKKLGYSPENMFRHAALSV